MLGHEQPAPGAVLAVGRRISAADVPILSLRVRLLLRGATDRRVVCDVAAVEGWDLATLDALARVALVARRLDGRLWLVGAPDDLPALLELVGLAEALPCCPRSALVGQRQPEHREEARGVEEERDAGDPPA